MSSEGLSFHILFPNHTNTKILMFPSQQGWVLPRIEGVSLPIEDLFDVCPVNKVIKDMFDVVVTTRYSLLAHDANNQKDNNIFILENHNPQWKPPVHGRWIGETELTKTTLVHPAFESLVNTFFATKAVTDREGISVPWWQPGWFDSTKREIIQKFDTMGCKTAPIIEQVTCTSYESSVLRIVADERAFYFKALAPCVYSELDITRLLAQWQPDYLPKLLAYNQQDHWMLMEDIGGIDLQEVDEISVWEDTLRAYARLQLASLPLLERYKSELNLSDCPLQYIARSAEKRISQVPDLLNIGSVPARGDGLLRQLDIFTAKELLALADLLPRLTAICSDIENDSMPTTIGHGDLHGENVRITQSGPVFLDWSKSYASHPFLGPVRLLADGALPFSVDEKAQLRSSYLEYWTSYESSFNLESLFGLLEPIWALYWVLLDIEVLRSFRDQHSNDRLLWDSIDEFWVRQKQMHLVGMLRQLLAYQV